MKIHDIDCTELDNMPSWALVDPPRDHVGLAIMAFCLLVILGAGTGYWLANLPDEYDRIRQACPGKSVDIWSRDGGTLLAIRCDLPEPSASW